MENFLSEHIHLRRPIDNPITRANTSTIPSKLRQWFAQLLYTQHTSKHTTVKPYVSTWKKIKQNNTNGNNHTTTIQSRANTLAGLKSPHEKKHRRAKQTNKHDSHLCIHCGDYDSAMSVSIRDDNIMYHLLSWYADEYRSALIYKNNMKNNLL